jgi:hypothetical protein
MTRRNPPDLSDLTPDEFTNWFTLQRLARDEKWEMMRALLQEQAPGSLRRHPPLVSAVRAAIDEGEGGIVAEMAARGFAVETEDMVEVIRSFIVSHWTGLQGRALDGWRAGLAAIKAVDRRAILDAALGDEKSDLIVAALHHAGFDVLRDGDVFARVIAQHDLAGFKGLLDAGLSVFAPAVVIAMTRMPPEDAPAAAFDLRHEWHRRVTTDNREGLDILLRGRIAEDAPFRAAQFLNPYRHDGSGAPVTLLGVLAAHGRTGEIFADPLRWAVHPLEAELVYKAFAEYGVVEEGALHGLAAHLSQARLAAARRGGPPRL